MRIDIAWFPDYGHLMAGIFFYIIEEFIEVDELNKGNISAAAGK